MKMNFGIAVFLAVVVCIVPPRTSAQMPPDEPGSSPGSIVLGPEGYFRKGPDTPGRGGRGAGRAGRGAAASTLSVRVDNRKVRTAAQGLLGWKIGVPGDAFGNLAFSEAAGKVDAAGLAFIEGSSAQRVSAELQKNLDFNLSPEEVAKVRSRLSELRLQMPAYRVDMLPSDSPSRRKLFEFAKSLGVETIVSGSDTSAADELDQLANEFGINVAFENLSSRKADEALRGRGKRIGVVADPAKWMKAGIKPLDGLALVKERLLVVSLRDSGAAAVDRFLLEVAKLDPPEAPVWPPKCGNCTGPRVAFGKPL
jgi:hypothetical protein